MNLSVVNLLSRFGDIFQGPAYLWGSHSKVFLKIGVPECKILDKYLPATLPKLNLFEGIF